MVYGLIHGENRSYEELCILQLGGVEGCDFWWNGGEIGLQQHVV